MKTLWILLRALFYAACGALLFIAFVMATRRFDRRFEDAFSTWTPVPGILLTTLGALLIFVCVAIFVVRGRGTPLVLDAPREFVASGPYRVVRNPLYLGSTTFLLGMALYLRLVSVLLFALGWAIFVHLFVVYFEEPELKRKFGATYEAYYAAVPRWMPRVHLTKTTVNSDASDMNRVRSKSLLRLLLVILAADAAAKGLMMIFGGRWILLRSFPDIPTSQITSLLLLTRMEAGGLDIALAFMLIAAVREPLRCGTVVTGTAIALIIGAITEMVGLYYYEMTGFFSVRVAWIHAAVRTAVAAMLLLLEARIHV